MGLNKIYLVPGEDSLNGGEPSAVNRRRGPMQEDLYVSGWSPRAQR